jgi:hypothetical protein
MRFVGIVYFALLLKADSFVLCGAILIKYALKMKGNFSYLAKG